ncbi:PRN1 [Symbiodinium natans]|uniref:PRN1 protein n=1 Tax=Symbiodinium natans TaxID=878477 RepID=A0A812L9J5_9DINO|nr:PRN1 [Symbiodinium natans]CAE7246938.1 PRN1 [Symbiodinium natans]
MRMWCVFEMAGFLHSKGPCADKSVLVCPVFTGPALVLAHLGLSVLLLTLFCTGLPFYPWAGVFASAMLFPCLLLLARVVIHHCRSIDAIQCQVRHFTVQQCSCTCCGCGHMDANGSTMNCDRLIILRCISAWFGSVASFESLVRTRLLKALVYQLANQAFSYWRIVQAASPVAFAVLDLLYWHYPDKIVIVLEATLKSATYLFCVVPCLAQLLLRLAYRIRNLGHSKLAQWLLSAVLVAAASLLYGAYFFCESALRSLSSDTFGQFVPADLALLTVMGTATVALWRCMPAVEMIETPQDPAGGSEPASPTAPVFAAPGTSLSL